MCSCLWFAVVTLKSRLTASIKLCNLANFAYWKWQTSSCFVKYFTDNEQFLSCTCSSDVFIFLYFRVHHLSFSGLTVLSEMLHTLHTTHRSVPLKSVSRPFHYQPFLLSFVFMWLSNVFHWEGCTDLSGLLFTGLVNVFIKLVFWLMAYVL